LKIALRSRRLPIQTLDLIEGPTRSAEEQNDPQAVCQIGVTGEIYTWIGHGRCSYALHEAESRNGPGHDEVLHR
jgi:hypothetical protein